MYSLRSVFIVSLLGLVSMWEQTSGAAVERLEESAFGKMPDGMAVRLFTLRNAQGMTAKVITYGAIVTELRVPDRQGALRVIYIEQQTGPFSRKVGELIARALIAVDPARAASLSRRYRVEISGFQHSQIARRCMPELLAAADAQFNWLA